MARKPSKKKALAPRRPAAKKRSARAAASKRPPPSPEGTELLSMEQAIEMLKTTRPTFYRWLRTGRIKGMKVGRQWRFYREDVERFLKGQGPRIELPTDIAPLVAALGKRLEAIGGKDPSPSGTEPVQRAIARIIMIGVKMHATDLHLEPFEGGAQLRCRVDGVLHPVAKFDVRLLPALVEQIKRMAACDVLEKTLSQDGRIVLSLPEPEGELDMRVNFLPAYLGEAVTIRILRRSDISLTLDRIDYAPGDRERLMRALHAPWGLIVVSGRTGSGKTTVLYSCLMHLASPERKLLSVEDPVEYLLPGVTQVQVADKKGLTFERALRAVMRSAPNIIMVGEIRNYEILMCALQASLTGHLVLTTLHVDSAAGALKRMADIGAQPFVIAEGTRLVSAQRLVRRLCTKCSVPAEPPGHLLARAEQICRDGGIGWPGPASAFRRPVGCPNCAQTGFRGRTLIVEMLEMTPEIARALRDGAPAEELERIAIRQGMTTQAADGVRRAAEGQTTLEEVFGGLGLP